MTAQLTMRRTITVHLLLAHLSSRELLDGTAVRCSPSASHRATPAEDGDLRDRAATQERVIIVEAYEPPRTFTMYAWPLSSGFRTPRPTGMSHLPGQALPMSYALQTSGRADIRAPDRGTARSTADTEIAALIEAEKTHCLCSIRTNRARLVSDTRRTACSGLQFMAMTAKAKAVRILMAQFKGCPSIR